MTMQSQKAAGGYKGPGYDNVKPNSKKFERRKGEKGTSSTVYPYNSGLESDSDDSY